MLDRDASEVTCAAWHSTAKTLLESLSDTIINIICIYIYIYRLYIYTLYIKPLRGGLGKVMEKQYEKRISFLVFVVELINGQNINVHARSIAKFMQFNN